MLGFSPAELIFFQRIFKSDAADGLNVFHQPKISRTRLEFLYIGPRVHGKFLKRLFGFPGQFFKET